MGDLTLSEVTVKHVVDVPIERFDIPGWLFNLPDAEFQRCCVPDHIAAGQTISEDGRKMSINVEKIGESLVIQHYVAEIVEQHFCRMVSISDVFTSLGQTKTRVLWELRAVSAGEGRTEYTNYVRGSTTDEFMTFIEQHGISYEEAKSARQAASGDHCRRETPFYAESIAKRSLSARVS
jgi:hypothetical protein